MASDALVQDPSFNPSILAARLAEGVTLAHPVILQQFRQAIQDPNACAQLREAVTREVRATVCIDGRCAPLLHHAAAQNEVGWLQVLLALGAPWDATDVNGASAAQWALEAKATPAFLALMTLGAPPAPSEEGRCSTLVHEVVRMGDARCLEALMQSIGATWPRTAWDRPDLQGMHPLHYAIDHDDRELQRILVEAGADWRERDADGNTVADRYARAHPLTPGAFLRDVVHDAAYAAWIEQRYPPPAPPAPPAPYAMPVLRVRQRVPVH